MDKIEERIKEILRQYSDSVLTLVISSGKPYLELDEATAQICQLFEPTRHNIITDAGKQLLKQIAKEQDMEIELFEPKPDESRLLTDEEVIRLGFKVCGKDFSRIDFCELPEFLLAQDAKTASIKDAECQARVERIFKEIYTRFCRFDKDTNEFCLNAKDWQALKKQEGVE